ncbi:hypothetical protein PSV09DRAFT_1084080 [Bipolaris maydis]|nr:hypothetical protein PSV09DRAFT_1084080 [Bipolaris maydis]
MMQHTSRPYGLDFVQLSPSVFYREPPKHARPTWRAISRDPHLIVIATWLNASPTQVQAYLSGYKSIFPTSGLLLIATTTKHFLFQPTAQRLRELEPAVRIFQNTKADEKVLLHVFSSGGTCTIYQLASAYNDHTSCPLPVSKIVFDSCPGVSSYRSTVAAFSTSLPQNPVLWTIGNVFYRIVFGIGLVAEKLTKWKNIVGWAYEGLNKKALFPDSAARLYLYSLADELVPWKHIEHHADEARNMCQKVWRVRYTSTAHVYHMFQDRRKYWDAVMGIWDSDYLSGPGKIRVAF